MLSSAPKYFLSLASLFFLTQQCTGNLARLEDDIDPYLSVSSNPVAGSIVGNFKQIQLRYATPVGGASRMENYALEGVMGTLQITAVTEESDGSFTLTTTGIAVKGSLTLKIRNVRDVHGRLPDPAGLSWQSMPTGPLILNSAPVQEAILQTVGYIDVCWDRPVINAASLAGYTLIVPAGSGRSINSVSVLSGNCYRVWLTGSVISGLYRLVWNGLTDLAGNPPAMGELRWTIDGSSPFVASSVPAIGSNLTGENFIEIYYSETVNGAQDKNNYIVSGPGSGSLVVQAVNPLPGRYRLQLQGTPASGAVSLNISNVTDLAGNPLTPPNVAYYFP